MKKNLLTIVLALVAMFANAQDKVSTATTWDFESYQSGATISNEIKNINGLFVRGAAGEGHDIIAEIHKRNGKFADGTAWKTRMAASVKEASSPGTQHQDRPLLRREYCRPRYADRADESPQGSRRSRVVPHLRRAGRCHR